VTDDQSAHLLQQLAGVTERNKLNHTIRSCSARHTQHCTVHAMQLLPQQ
jgi:hypothetical protein